MKRNILELRSEEIKLYIPENEIKEQILSMGFEWKDWYLHQIYRPIEIVDNYRFWYEDHVCKMIVSPQDIIGADHDSIKQGTTWLYEFFNQSRNTSTNIHYIKKGILNPKDKSPIQLLCYGNRYFIYYDGRHRVVNSKFLQLDEIPCSVHYYSFSNESYNLYLRLSKIVGPDVLSDIKTFTLNASIVIQWQGCSFSIPWNEDGILAMESIKLKADRICLNPFLRLYYRLKHHNEYVFINVQDPLDQKKAILIVYNHLLKGIHSFSHDG